MCVNELWKPYLLVQSHRCMALSPRLTLVGEQFSPSNITTVSNLSL